VKQTNSPFANDICKRKKMSPIWRENGSFWTSWVCSTGSWKQI